MSQNLKKSTNSSLLSNEVEKTISDSTIDSLEKVEKTISDSTIDSLEKDKSSEQEETQDFSSTKYSESETTLPEQALEENTPMQRPSSNMAAESNSSNDDDRKMSEYPRSNNTGDRPRYNRPRSNNSARFSENRPDNRSSSFDGVTSNNSRGDSQGLNGNTSGGERRFAPRTRSFGGGSRSGGWSPRNRTNGNGFGGNSFQSRNDGGRFAPRNNFNNRNNFSNNDQFANKMDNRNTNMMNNDGSMIQDRTSRYENANTPNAVDANVFNDSQSSMAPTSSSRDFSTSTRSFDNRPYRRPFNDRRSSNNEMGANNNGSSSDNPMSNNNHRFDNRSGGRTGGFRPNRGGFGNRGGSGFSRPWSSEGRFSSNRFRANDATSSQQSNFKPYGHFNNTGQENTRDNASSNSSNISYDRNFSPRQHNGSNHTDNRTNIENTQFGHKKQGSFDKTNESARSSYKEGRDFADYNIKSRQEEYKAHPEKSPSDDQSNN